MFYYLPFFTFAGAMVYLFPDVGLWLGGAYLAALLLPHLWRML